MDAGKKIVIAAVMAAALFCGCSGKKPVNKCPDPLNTGVAYENASWTVAVNRLIGKQSEKKTFRVYYACGNYRVQEETGPGEPIKALIIRNGIIYLPNFQSKTVFTDSAGNGGAEPYLKSIFINIGTAKKQMGPVYNGRAGSYRCDVQEFRMLRAVGGIYMNTALKQFYDKRTGFIVRMETYSPENEITMGTGKTVIGPAYETYAVEEFKHDAVPEAMFVLPPDFRQVDLKKQYEEMMKKSGKKPGKSSAIRELKIK